MNTASQYFYLLRWLVFPSIFLSTLMAVVLAGASITVWSFLKVDPLVGKVFYPLPVFFYIFLLFNFQTRFALLFARKTMTLTGVLAWRLTVIGFGLMTLLSLGLTPSVLGVENLASVINWFRATILILSFMTLLIYIGALTRLNLLFVSLVILAIPLWDSAAFIAIATAAWREGSMALYGALLLLTLALWAALYLRIAYSRLPTPLSETFKEWSREGQSPSSAELGLTLWIARLLQGLRPSGSAGKPIGSLLLESDPPMLGLFLPALGNTILMSLIFAPVWYVTGGEDFQFLTLWAALMVVISTFHQAENVGWVASNIRRLWLMIPGGRREMTRHLERTFFKTSVLGLLPFLALSAGIMVITQQPLWWITCWTLLAPLTLLLLSYMHLSILAWDHFLLPIVRALFWVAILALGSVFWIAQHAIYSGSLIIGMLAVTLLLRHFAWRRWLGMDYSLLGKKVARI